MSVKDGKLLAASEQKAHHVGAIITFKTRRRGEKIQARVASSFISSAQACQNLKELGGSDMEQLKLQGRHRWNEILGRIEVEALSIAVFIAPCSFLVLSTKRMRQAK